ncbi:MAG: class I SAM-dependent methyltransferase [Minisyncoccia bacterium]
MNKITHIEQQKIWDKEHQNPHVLLQMDAQDPSGGVVRFFDFIKDQKLSDLLGIEMGCGKGRNVIFLASQKENKKVYGFDFSPSAIQVAKERNEKAGVSDKAGFFVGDATMSWPFDSNLFDYVIDNFASTDIESPGGRKFAIGEIKRVLKSGVFSCSILLLRMMNFIGR